MDGFLELNRGVNIGDEEDERDVMATKSALQESGDYTPPGGRISGWRDPETDHGLRNVQIRNNVWPDSRMRPGGPTHRLINAEKNERQTGSVPKSIGLSGAVGRHAGNNPLDIQKWRSNLGRLGYLPKADADRSGTRFDNPLEWATIRFQTDYNRKPDGLVTPGGETETIMARVAAPLKVKLAASGGGVQPVGQNRATINQTATPSKKPAPTAQTPRPEDKPWYERLGESVGDSLARRHESRLEVMGAAASLGLRGLASAAEQRGDKHSPERLRYFLDGSGMDREISRDEARKREPVQIGEPENQRQIESRLAEGIVSGDFGAAQQRRSSPDLSALKDGETIRITQLNGQNFRTGFNAEESKYKTNEDERLATGRTTFVSNIPDGLNAVRHGDIVTVFGTVEHRWDDRYDFKAQADPSSFGGVVTNLAVTARDHGTAREFTTYAHWRQGLRASYRIVDGELVPLDIQWTDHAPEADLR